LGGLILKHIKNILRKLTNFIDFKLLKIEKAFTLHEDINRVVREKKLPYFVATDGLNLLLITQCGFINLFCIREYGEDVKAFFDEQLLCISYGSRELIISPKGELIES
jgi:hypothetical protein